MHVIHIGESCSKNLTKKITYYRVDDGKLMLSLQLQTGSIVKDSLMHLTKSFKGDVESFLILDELECNGYTIESDWSIKKFKLSSSFYPVLDTVKDPSVVRQRIEISKDGFERECKRVALMEILHKRSMISVRLMDDLDGVKEKERYVYLNQERLKSFIESLPHITKCLLKLYEQDIENIYLYSDSSVMSIQISSGKFICLSLNGKVYSEVHRNLFGNRLQ